MPRMPHSKEIGYVPVRKPNAGGQYRSLPCMYPYCKEPMIVPPGTIMYTHGRCRRAARAMGLTGRAMISAYKKKQEIREPRYNSVVLPKRAPWYMRAARWVLRKINGHV